ncbi:hypothetical protein JQ580_18555 [Bradyrhizobium japonicum]|jgi:hypothetical protein|uniref:hypothetical protein n=1 Tax=Bradyrhizobium japonicum TaxID=375 RepID=UPI001BA4C798|nr:hypothetical protein [Bradyrhizobium japonicum]MBR0992720.1 hypothetical protein [Bradyrhizobium japonicum]
MTEHRDGCDSKSAIDPRDIANMLDAMKQIGVDISVPVVNEEARIGNVLYANGGCDPHDCSGFKPGSCSGVTCPTKSSACPTEACSTKVCANHTCQSVSCEKVSCNNYHHWESRASTHGALTAAMSSLPAESWSQLSSRSLSAPDRAT